MTKNKPGGLFGLWIETKDNKDGYAILLWGQFQPNAPASPVLPTNPEQPSASEKEQGASETEPTAARESAAVQEKRPEAAPKSDAPAIAVPAKAPAKATAKPVTKAVPKASVTKANVTRSPRKTVAVRPKTERPLSAAQRQAEAMKKLNDYNYVKFFGPISGPMYRSSKW